MSETDDSFEGTIYKIDTNSFTSSDLDIFISAIEETPQISIQKAEKRRKNNSSDDHVYEYVSSGISYEELDDFSESQRQVKLLDRKVLVGSQTSVLGSRSTVLGSQRTLIGSQRTLLESQRTLLGSRIGIVESQSTLPGSLTSLSTTSINQYSSINSLYATIAKNPPTGKMSRSILEMFQYFDEPVQIQEVHDSRDKLMAYDEEKYDAQVYLYKKNQKNTTVMSTVLDAANANTKQKNVNYVSKALEMSNAQLESSNSMDISKNVGRLDRSIIQFFEEKSKGVSPPRPKSFYNQTKDKIKKNLPLFTKKSPEKEVKPLRQNLNAAIKEKWLASDLHYSQMVNDSYGRIEEMLKKLRTKSVLKKQKNLEAPNKFYKNPPEVVETASTVLTFDDPGTLEQFVTPLKGNRNSTLLSVYDEKPSKIDVPQTYTPVYKGPTFSDSYNNIIHNSSMSIFDMPSVSERDPTEDQSPVIFLDDYITVENNDQILEAEELLSNIELDFNQLVMSIVTKNEYLTPECLLRCHILSEMDNEDYKFLSAYNLHSIGNETGRFGVKLKATLMHPETEDRVVLELIFYCLPEDDGGKIIDELWIPPKTIIIYVGFILQPPENELQKSHDNNTNLSEHQLRVQASLQRLNVPDWYKNYGNTPTNSSVHDSSGILRKRNSDVGRTGGWTGLSSKTTSLSSLGSQRCDRSPVMLSPSAHSHHGQTGFTRWSTSHLNSNQTSPSVSTRGSFSRGNLTGGYQSAGNTLRNSIRQPYLGWRSQEKLSQPRTPAERLASSLLQQKQQQQQQQSGGADKPPKVPRPDHLTSGHSPLQQHPPVTPEIQHSIKEVTSAIVHYVNDQTSKNSRSRSTSPSQRYVKP